MKLATLPLGRISTNICTCYRHISASTIFTFFHSRSTLRMFLTSIFSLYKILFFYISLQRLYGICSSILYMLNCFDHPFNDLPLVFFAILFYTKRSFLFHITGCHFSLNHLPCEWFSLYNRR